MLLRCITYVGLFICTTVNLLLETDARALCNKYKLQNHSFHYNFQKFSFAARVVYVWNNLPDHVV